MKAFKKIITSHKEKSEIVPEPTHHEPVSQEVDKRISFVRGLVAKANDGL